MLNLKKSDKPIEVLMSKRIGLLRNHIRGIGKFLIFPKSIVFYPLCSSLTNELPRNYERVGGGGIKLPQAWDAYHASIPS